MASNRLGCNLLDCPEWATLTHARKHAHATDYTEWNNFYKCCGHHLSHSPNHLILAIDFEAYRKNKSNMIMLLMRPIKSFWCVCVCACVCRTQHTHIMREACQCHWIYISYKIVSRTFCCSRSDIHLTYHKERGFELIAKHDAIAAMLLSLYKCTALWSSTLFFSLCLSLSTSLLIQILRSQ